MSSDDENVGNSHYDNLAGVITNYYNLLKQQLNNIYQESQI